MSPIRTARYTRQRTIFIGALVTVAILGLVAYVGFQARFLIEGPLVSLTGDLPTLQRERQIELAGTAQNATALTLNGRAIVIDETGAFTEPVILENGYTVIRIEATDRYGRTTAIERPFVYAPASLSLAE